MSLQAFERLEALWAEALGLYPRNMVAVCNGTAALHLATELCPRGGSFIGGESPIGLPDLCMIACPRSVRMAQRSCVLCDCNDHDLLMDLGKITNNNSRLMSGVMAVHNYGRRVPMEDLHDVIQRISPARTPAVIEDLAELHGTPPHPDTFAACWSFYRNKVVGGEEGGAVYFLDRAVADEARSMRCLGFRDPQDYWHAPHGYNYRLSNANAELILTVLGEMAHRLDQRRSMEYLYETFLPSETRMPERISPWMYDLRIRGMNKEEQTDLVARLTGKGVASRPCFRPTSKQPEFRRKGLETGPNAEKASVEVITLPLYPYSRGSADLAQEEVARTLDSVYQRHASPSVG